jgi:hypothetical protein
MDTQYFPPSCTRYSGLTPFLGTQPMDYDQVKAIRREATQSRGGFEGFMAWAKDHYTWDMWVREVNHLPKSTAKAMLSLLLMRDVGKDNELGLLGNPPTPLADAEALPGIKLLDYLVGWQRLANRYAWYARACVDLPDPLKDPLPPLDVDNYAGFEVAKFFKPLIQNVQYKIDSSSVVDVIASAVLYVFGYLAEKPSRYSEEVWQQTLQGLFTKPFPLARWVLHPTDALNFIVLEYAGTGWNGFYPTPLNLADLMGTMAGRCFDPAPGDEDDSLYATPWEGVESQEERMRRLSETVSDPCVGTGNFIWPILNRFVFGHFTDISQNKVLTTRAMCAVFAPWFTNSIFQLDSLADFGDRAKEKIAAQTKAYHEQEGAALLGFLQHVDSVQSDRRDAGAHEPLLAEIRARGMGRRLSRQVEPWLALQKQLSGSDLPEMQSAAMMVPTLNPIRNEFEQTKLFDQYALIGKEK